MSAIVGRILIAVGIGVVSALYYTYYRNRQEERSYHNHGRRGGPRNDSYSYPSNTWREDDDEYNFLNPSPRQPTTSKPRRRFNDDAGSLCPICLETFRDLKNKGVSIWSTPCGHLFCEECLSKAFRERRRPQSDVVLLPCPTCRECVPGLKSCRKEFI